MFCAGCGTQIHSGLNYCSRCGRRAVENETERASVAKSMASSLGYIGGFGFFGYFAVVLVIVKNPVPPNLLLPITFFYFAALFGICYLVLRQTDFLRRSDERRDAAPSHEPSYLRPVTTAQLEEGRPFDIGTVTDATTRTLDEVPVRKS